MSDNRPIGIMDSGMGGISVLKEIVALMPQEKYIFYGDSANAPYGDRTTEEVCHLTEAVVKKLLDENIKALVIACNTASSAAGEVLRQKYPELPIVAIEPALKPAVLSKPGSRVLVLATSTTLREKKFQHLLESYKAQAEIIKMPLPGLPEFVERGELDSPKLRAFLKKHFDQLEKPVDSTVLGCTHYPFVRKIISELLGEQVRIFDGAAGTARQLKHRLEENNMLRSVLGDGGITWLNSSTDPVMNQRAISLFEKKI